MDQASSQNVNLSQEPATGLAGFMTKCPIWR